MRQYFFTAVYFALYLSQAPVSAQEASATAVVSDMAQIEKAWQQGNFALVRFGLEHLATTTDTALVQYRYGRILLEGRGGDQDIDAAVGWLQKAVDQNHAEAAALLAKVYLSEFDQDEKLVNLCLRDRICAISQILYLAVGFLLCSHPPRF